MTHQEYLKKRLGKKIDFDRAFAYQCVDLARHYCSEVRKYTTRAFGGSAIAGRTNRARTFQGKRRITGRPADATDINVGDVVIFKANVAVQAKAPGVTRWTNTRFTKYGHVGIIDYIDNDGVMRIVEQNGAGSGSGTGRDAIRLWGYKGKESVAGFILQ